MTNIESRLRHLEILAGIPAEKEKPVQGGGCLWFICLYFGMVFLVYWTFEGVYYVIAETAREEIRKAAQIPVKPTEAKE